MIELRNITKTYRTGGVVTEALRSINLNVSKGEMVGIIGSSGCGKTTLLNILGAMDAPTGGQYLFDGKDVSAMGRRSLSEFRRDNISFIFQNFALLNKETVAENIEIPLLAKHVNAKERQEVIKESLAKAGIPELENKRVYGLSGGQQQRCAIARAIASGNQLLLCDEPTGSLDSRTTSEIMDLLVDVNKDGRTLIIVTHDTAVANRCDRIIEIYDGVIEEE